MKGTAVGEGVRVGVGRAVAVAVAVADGIRLGSGVGVEVKWAVAMRVGRTTVPPTTTGEARGSACPQAGIRMSQRRKPPLL
jgi:hypothetical protein